MPVDVRTAGLWAAAYLIGGIPFGVLIARLKGVDIRRHGSGNIGATNVGRTLGRGWGLLVFGLDAGKCLAVMCTARALLSAFTGAANSWGERPQVGGAWLLAITGLAAIVGSIAPIYLGFRGGKAVSATVGTLLGVWPDMAIPGLACLLLWLAVAAASRYVSLASIIAVASHPILMGVFGRWVLRRDISQTYPLYLLSAAIAILVVVRHRSNIARLRAGTEKRIGQKAEPGSARA